MEHPDKRRAITTTAKMKAILIIVKTGFIFTTSNTSSNKSTNNNNARNDNNNNTLILYNVLMFNDHPESKALSRNPKLLPSSLEPEMGPLVPYEATNSCRLGQNEVSHERIHTLGPPNPKSSIVWDLDMTGVSFCFFSQIMMRNAAFPTDNLSVVGRGWRNGSLHWSPYSSARPPIHISLLTTSYARECIISSVVSL